MTQNVRSSSADLRAQHALTEDELAAYMQRCPENQRAFEGYLRGERSLAGDLDGQGVNVEPEYR
jgi:hypothetical protein